jgi:hypothetical protein
MKRESNAMGIDRASIALDPVARASTYCAHRDWRILC